MKIVLTGASSGIGSALARKFIERGDTLFCCARRIELLRSVCAGSSAAYPYQCDVGDAEAVGRFAKAVAQQSGSIDVLINCASSFGAIGPTLETETAAFVQTINDNLIGTYLMCKEFLPLLRSSSQASIVNFSGGGALSPFPRYSGYAISKAGIVRLTENLAIELRPDKIRVNAIAPGFVATEIHNATLAVGAEKAGSEHFNLTNQGLQGKAVPIEVPVACVEFLISSQAAGLTGKTISASFDPWNSSDFHAAIEQINESDLYTMRRINLVNLGISSVSALKKQPQKG